MMLHRIQYLKDFLTGSLSSSPICKFLFDGGEDNKGRTLEEYHAFTHEDMETIHDYIQWMFPLNEKSNFNPEAPVLTKRDVRYGTSTLILEGNRNKVILNNLTKYCDFLFSEYGYSVLQKPFDHNHLRISRVIKCLRLFDLESEAEQFLLTIRLGNEKVLSESIKHWEQAMNKKLWSIK